MYKAILKKILRHTNLLFLSGTLLGVLGYIGRTFVNDFGLISIILTLLGLGLISCAFLSTNTSIVRKFLLDNGELEKLISELQTGDPRQRRVAAHKVGLSKNPTVVSALIHAYDDGDDSVRKMVIEGLGNIASKEAIDFLNLKEIPISSKPEVPLKTDFARLVIFIVILIALTVLFIPLWLVIGIR
jgi:hypothetical protein